MAKPSIELPPPTRSLSARLLVLTIIFVLLGEVFIFVPSIARFRAEYLSQRIEAARLAALTVEAVPDAMVSEMLGHELLRHADVRAISLKREGQRNFILAESMPAEVAATYELDEATIVDLIGDAFAMLWHSDWEAIRVMALSPKDTEQVWVDIVVDAQPLRHEMLAYLVRILLLSLVLAGITASLIFLSIHFLLVRPMRQMTESLVGFQLNPEDTATDVRVSRRRDEIGVAQRELLRMQEEVRQSLRRQARLAAVGSAVSKINHDLRNMLSTAAVMTDRLALARDAEVQRLAQPLIGAIDRAINLCTQTLAFARADAARLNRTRFTLKPLAQEVAADLRVKNGEGIVWRTDIPDDVMVEADRDQLFRVLLNLVNNAAQALTPKPGAGETRSQPQISMRAEARRNAVVIEVADNGPGLPDAAREHLFEAFSGAGRSGGTGLGLVIARDLVRNHGGELSLVRTGPEGTCFRIVLPVAEQSSEAA